MFIYVQKTGQLLASGITIANGYSGAGEGKNNPAMQHVKNVGPIPVGFYTYRAPFDSDAHGPFCLMLEPEPANEMHGRSGFLCHGDSVANPGTASEGCIIMPRAVRMRLDAALDRRIQVVSSMPE